ncbi:MAG: hypothetical protein PUH44_06730, partial [Bacteroidales bacterium]|nr:hypothetical protein [Bacteroidales bacterium]MDY2705494.1 hypothetical protein [Alloprevotella sp.]
DLRPRVTRPAPAGRWLCAEKKREQAAVKRESLSKKAKAASKKAKAASKKACDVGTAIAP